MRLQLYQMCECLCILCSHRLKFVAEFKHFYFIWISALSLGTIIIQAIRVDPAPYHRLSLALEKVTGTLPRIVWLSIISFVKQTDLKVNCYRFLACFWKLRGLWIVISGLHFDYDLFFKYWMRWEKWSIVKNCNLLFGFKPEDLHFVPTKSLLHRCMRYAVEEYRHEEWLKIHSNEGPQQARRDDGNFLYL